MTTIGRDLKTYFASPERCSEDEILQTAMTLKKEPLLSWFEAVPMGTVIINHHRQILFCNEAFRALTGKPACDDNIGMRPGEALDCVNARAVEAGCGCSKFCDVCGAANAIIRSLEGTADCQECRLLRFEDDMELPLDLQVFTKPIEFQGQPLVIIFTMDISHEKRLKYLNRTFYHGLISAVGGISTLTELLEAGPEDSSLYELLVESSKRTLRDILYHHDVEAAENGRLATNIEPLDASAYLNKLILEECIFRNTQASSVEVTTACSTLTSDKRILGHVIRNMLSNALEARVATPGQITLACNQLDDGRVSIAMQNPGVIPKNIQKQMFKRYVSTKSRDRGLGTYVIRLFTEKYLGGTVSFSSGNAITTFEIILPAED